MARVTDQDIPSELRDLYGLNLQPQTDQIKDQAPKYVKVRDPFRLPKMQGISGPHIGKAQTAQRQKVRDLVNIWGRFSKYERDRWAAEKYREGSVLFYWNFFILEGLLGGGPLEAPQMIKSIQVIKQSVPTTGGSAFTTTAIDPAKTVVMMHGNSLIRDLIQRHTGTMADNTETTINLSPSITLAIAEVNVRGAGGHMEFSEGQGEGEWADIALSYLSTTQAKIKLPQLYSPGVFPYSLEIIEHKAQTVYPVLVSVLTEAVNIDWALVPDAAADVSIQVVEYI